MSAKLCILSIAFSLLLLGCGNSKNSSEIINKDNQVKDINNTITTKDDYSEKIDAQTAKFIETLQSSPNQTNCKIPKADYQSISCFISGEKTIFIAENHSPNYDLLARDLIDVYGQKIADLKQYDRVDYEINMGLIAVGKDDKIGYINTKGELVIPLIYESINNPDNKYDESWVNAPSSYGIIVKKDGKFGIIDRDNKVILPFEYGELSGFDDSGTGLYHQYSDTIDEYDEGELLEWGIIDYIGKKIPLSDKYEGTIGNFSSYDGFREELLGVGDYNNKYGFINKKGEVVIPLEYDEIRSFSEGLAGVLKGDKWGFIDKNNKTVIDFQYPDETVPRYSVNYMGAFMFIFDNGQAEVSSNIQDETICIDKSANKVECEGGFNH